MAGITPIGRRLNEIQNDQGHRASFRAFWRALVDPEFWEARGKAAPDVSREAARTYHLDRDPPSSYVLAIVERFDVNPAWLLTGEPEGLMYMKQVREAQVATLKESDHPFWGPAIQAVPELAEWPTAARLLFAETVGRYLTSFEGYELILGLESERESQALQALSRDLFDMVNVSYHSMRVVGRWEFLQYLVAMLHGIQLRFPDVGQGPHIFYRFETLDPEYATGPAPKLDGPLTEVTPSRWAEERHGK